MTILDFDEALEEAIGEYSTQPHLLLGNGFSQAYQSDIFSYNALFDRADFREMSGEAREAFDVLETRDFEEVMSSLSSAARLMRLYGGEHSVAERLEADAEGLREVLARAISESHPDHPGEIESEAYAHCREFLSNFDRIYSLNYDLLLYWTLMQDDIRPAVPSDDGFRAPDYDAEYVVWEPDRAYRQNVYYLHGGLHLFDRGGEIQKYTWINTGVPLIEQIREALDNQRFPIFVAEGKSERKLEKIRHNAYLARNERSIVSVRGPMFVYGFSMGDQDEHIVELIEKSNIDALYVSLYGDPDSESNRSIRAKAQRIVDARGEHEPLRTRFYDAESARVWE